jgi:glycosyltransferase involved in cell wall biosynthesis
MLGTDERTRGGISTVISVYRQQGLFDRWGAVHLPTHRDGSALRKLGAALWAWGRFMAWLLAGRVALLHVHLSRGASFWRKLAFIAPALGLGTPVLLHVHSGRFAVFFSELPRPAQAVVRWALRRAQQVLALSDEARLALLRIEPRARVQVLPNPIALPPWQAPLAGPTPTVLFLGQLTAAKGVEDLVAVWAEVRRAVPQAELVLGGSGDMAAVRALCERAGVGHCVQLRGWVTGDAKTALLKRAWVLALPSHHEALPMAVLEALAAGVPVVASRVGGIPLAVEDGVCGRLIAPQDRPALATALADLLSQAATRQQFGAAARARARDRFSADVRVPQLESLWSELLAGKQPSHRGT